MSPGPGSARPQPLDHFRIMSARHEADVLAVLLVGNRKPEPARQLARFRLGAIAERKAQQVELLARCAEQEIALVAFGLTGAVQRPAAIRQRPRSDIMAGRQSLGAEFARGIEQVAEFDRLIALDARHRGLAGDVTCGEPVDHRFLEAAFVVEHVMRNADAFGNRAGIMDIAAGAAGAFAVGRGAVVVELKRDADDVVTRIGQ
jgi:hypothetical protein